MSNDHGPANDVDVVADAVEGVGEQAVNNVVAERKPVKITNWSTNKQAQLSVLEVWNQHECHIAPYGQGGKRMKNAANALQTLHGYTANVRTMNGWVTDFMEAHDTEENRLDNETGAMSHRGLWAFF